MSVVNATFARLAASRPSPRTAVAVSVGAAALAASFLVNTAFQRARSVETLYGADVTTAPLFPVTVAADLGVLAALVLAVATVARATSGGMGAGPSRADVAPAAAIGLAAAAMVGFASGWFNGVLAAAVFGLLLWAAPRLAGSNRRGVLLACSAGFLLRAAAAVALSAYGRTVSGVPIVFDEEMDYFQGAQQVAAALVRGNGDLDWSFRHLTGYFLDLAGVISSVPGTDFTSVRLLNVTLGSLAVALTYGVANRFLSESGGLVAAWLVALWPMLILWNAAGLHDALALTAALLLSWLLVRSRAAGRGVLVTSVVAGLLALWVLASIRPHIALAACVVILFVLLRAAPRGATRFRTELSIAGLITVAVLLGYASNAAARGPGAVFEELSPPALERRAANMQLAPTVEAELRQRGPAPASPLPVGSVVRARPSAEGALVTGIIAWYEGAPPRYEILTSDDRRLFLPPADVLPVNGETVGWGAVVERLMYVLGLFFVPSLPLSLARLPRTAMALDTILWDLLVAAAVVGALLRPNRSAAWLSMLLFPAMVVLGVSVASTNLGTVVRHRDMVVPWLAVAATPALLVLVNRIASLARSRPVGSAGPARALTTTGR